MNQETFEQMVERITVAMPDCFIGLFVKECGNTHRAETLENVISCGIRCVPRPRLLLKLGYTAMASIALPRSNQQERNKEHEHFCCLHQAYSCH